MREYIRYPAPGLRPRIAVPVPHLFLTRLVNIGRTPPRTYPHVQSLTIAVARRVSARAFPSAPVWVPSHPPGGYPVCAYRVPRPSVDGVRPSESSERYMPRTSAGVSLHSRTSPM